MKILTQKFALFGFFRAEGKKKWSFVVVCWVLNENSTQRELTHATHVNSRQGIFDFYFRNERNCLGKEQDSFKKNYAEIEQNQNVLASCTSFQYCSFLFSQTRSNTLKLQNLIFQATIPIFKRM